MITPNEIRSKENLDKFYTHIDKRLEENFLGKNCVEVNIYSFKIEEDVVEDLLSEYKEYWSIISVTHTMDNYTACLYFTAKK